ncbi:TPA: hypothetical protein ACE8F8_002186, partial [Neisseria gonorrhoeae]
RDSGNTRQRLIFDLRPKGWLRHSRAGGNPGLSARKLIGKTVSSDFTSWIPARAGMTASV